MSSIGPQIPAHLLPTPTAEDSDEDDDYTPALPPDLLAARTQPGPSSGTPRPTSPPVPPPAASASISRSAADSSSRRVVGPSFPGPNSYDDDSDDDVGPKPLPAGLSAAHEERSGVQEFLEREERRRKQAEEDSKPKALKREEWMLVPPKASDLLGSLDPTKLKARQFARTAQPERNASSSLWTETPAERQQRIADEVAGRKRRAADAKPEEEDDDARKRRRRDAEIRKGVEEHTRKARGAALVDVHASGSKGKDEDDAEKPAGIWDHARDMSLGGRLMDDGQRKKMLQDAKSLGDRFGSGKSGGFL
ncbi:hypothetical protein BV22DRAFT_417566 [Leucogyrophana mollusca]|uniref:Uncharacterized protein n=1 Tax=Leucogyrophana mollusca TaxID=85980 RepID=A0ACB8BJC7_9AGAM|nr:hypothetical protein BV22DRAFT_417566 [Leucogyrophana mollusca]